MFMACLYVDQVLDVARKMKWMVGSVCGSLNKNIRWLQTKDEKVLKINKTKVNINE